MNLDQSIAAPQKTSQERLAWSHISNLEEQRSTVRKRIAFYRRRVILTKYFLPIVAFVLITLIVVWPQLNPNKNQFRLGAAEGTVYSFRGDGLKVMGPRLVGLDKDDQPFVVTADEAKQKSKEDETIFMNNPKADITLENGNWIVLSAKIGAINEAENRALFRQDVTLYHDDGYEAQGDKVFVNTQNGHTESDEPVKVKGPIGVIDASGFELKSTGNELFFKGPAKLTLYSGFEQ